MTEMDPAVSQPLELRTRIASGAVLIFAVIVAVLGGTLLFGAMIALGAIVALREWHRLVNEGSLAWETIPSALALLIVVGLAQLQVPVLGLLAMIALGAGAAALIAAARNAWVFWHALGVIYIGLPALALVALREDEMRGGILVGGVFAAVWAADTGALFIGRAIGGPHLGKWLSPNKTWSGLIGGIAAAGIAEAIYVALLGGSVALAALFGVVLGIAANCGDLFESWVKRIFHAKNSGNLIPGHGGILDRVDSLLFAAPAAAILLFATGQSPLFGVDR